MALKSIFTILFLQLELMKRLKKKKIKNKNNYNLKINYLIDGFNFHLRTINI